MLTQSMLLPITSKQNNNNETMTSTTFNQTQYIILNLNFQVYNISDFQRELILTTEQITLTLSSLDKMGDI